MKLALIPPYDLLQYTEESNYQLMLPQCVEESERYANHYHKLCQDGDQFVILDNGAAEGVAFDWEKLIDIAYQFEVNEIVIPDTLGNKNETIEKAQMFKQYFEVGHTHCQWQFLRDFQFMFVVQGQNLDEVLESAAWAAEESWITTIGIPRHMIDTLELQTARIRIANEITKMHVNKDIHFLGANGKAPGEMQSLATRATTNQAYVRGMDTSLPFNYAYKRYGVGTKLEPAVRSLHRPDGYFNLPAEEFDPEILDHNVKVVFRYTNGSR